MNYNDALAYINDKGKFGSRLGLSSIGRLMELLDNPQDDLKHIHIGGTNGKGSTSSFISHVLKTAGYKVGLFSSPYIERFNERIQINGLDIPDEDLGRLTGLIEEKANIMLEEGLEHPTTFEIITAIAFLYFKEENVDYVILEVGLGGRYDSTNIIKAPLASVLTTIDYDHIDVLGDTLEKIAYQKAGIIKDESLVITYPQKPEVLGVIEEEVKLRKSRLFRFPMENININKVTEFGTTFDFCYEGQTIKDIEISMLGEYQIYNASLAATAIFVLREKGLVEISDEEIKKGLKETTWPGRLEVMRRNPTFLIDGAHNVQGVEQLTKALSLFKYDKLILGIGILEDKDSSHMVELLAPKADQIIVTEVNMPRKLKAEELGRQIEKYNKNIIIEKDIKKAIEKSLELAGENDMIVFGGSLYLIGEVRTLIKQL